MICEECQQRPATVHLTTVVQNQKRESHLCEVCAREIGEFDGVDPQAAFGQLLAGLFALPPASTSDEAADPVVCSVCGLSYRTFSQTGKLGCPHCYEDFRQELVSLLRRVQGNGLHTGKLPQRRGDRYRLRRDVDRLRQELADRVGREAFEEAAAIRDRIRQLEVELAAEGREQDAGRAPEDTPGPVDER